MAKKSKFGVNTYIKRTKPKIGRHKKNMNKSERINIISRILDDHYKETPVPLDHSDPFTLLIAVLLSAQCTDERVNKVTPLLLKKLVILKK